MTFKHLRLVAASVTVVLFGTSCSTAVDTSSIDTSSNVSNGLAKEPSPQVSVERRRALVVHWLANARKLRAQGELQAARLELLKAKDMAPRNQLVAADLATLKAEIGIPDGVTSVNDGALMRLTSIAAVRARATVQHQLQIAQQRMSDKDYAGAVDELRRAALGIKIKNDIDWGEQSAQVQDALARAQHLHDAQEQERKTSAKQSAK
ncbi:MAG: hypothetical protein ACI9SE_003548 [Neolewinella sp.]|jgi:hypothetical protein